MRSPHPVSNGEATRKRTSSNMQRCRPMDFIAQRLFFGVTLVILLLCLCRVMTPHTGYMALLPMLFCILAFYTFRMVGEFPFRR